MNEPIGISSPSPPSPRRADSTQRVSSSATDKPSWLPGSRLCVGARALGATAAILERSHTGHGQRIEVSAQEAALGGLVPWTVIVPDYLDVNPFLPVEGTRSADGLYYVLPCADGYVRVVLTSGRDWDLFIELLGAPDELEGPSGRISPTAE